MNNENKISIILPADRYKGAPELDNNLVFELDSKQKEVIEYDRNANVFLDELYDSERQGSTYFNLSAKLTTIFQNQYTGETNYSAYKNELYYVNEYYYQTQSFLANFNGYWGGFPQYKEFDLSRNDFNNNGYTTGNNPHIDFTQKDAPKYNWNFYLTYPYSNDYTKTLNNYNGFYVSWTSGDGIPFQTSYFTYNGQNLILFKCFVKHGLSAGETVQLSEIYTNPSTGVQTDLFEVYSLGNDTLNSEEYYFSILNIGYLNNFLIPDTVGTFKRVLDPNNLSETTSKYYIRQHIVLEDYDNLVLTNAGFEREIFSDEKKFFQAALTTNQQDRVAYKEGTSVYNLTNKTRIDINGLIDNNKRPLIELYYTIINKGRFGWFNPPVAGGNTSLKQGWGFNIDYPSPSIYWSRNPNNSVSDTNIQISSFSKIENNQTYTFYYNNDLNVGDIIDGDFCEWNDFEQRERVISDYHHKFVLNTDVFVNTSADLLENRNPRGYYYKPHYKFKLRVFSDYVETAPLTEKVVGIPNYAFYSQVNQEYRWRDLYPYGYIDGFGNGVDNPYTNDSHYIHQNFIFKIIPEGSNYAINDTDYINSPIEDGCE